MFIFWHIFCITITTVLHNTDEKMRIMDMFCTLILQTSLLADRPAYRTGRLDKRTFVFWEKHVICKLT